MAWLPRLGVLLSVFLPLFGAEPAPDWNVPGRLGYHALQVDPKDGSLRPWLAVAPSQAYDQTLRKVWDFWRTMRSDASGTPYFLQHQVWRGDFDDRRGLGGDQFAMALDSLELLYQYLGDERALEYRKLIADFYLTRSLSPADAVWPNLPYPYNTLVYSGVFDGDMVLGKGYTQPDKAGSFGWGLLRLHRATGNPRYLAHAVAIADTLAAHMKAGDASHSPLPFKVHAMTGEVGRLEPSYGEERTKVIPSTYTTNYTGTLRLLEALAEAGLGKAAAYREAQALLLAWMKQYPLKTQRWGPFFEDIPIWSDTQINAVSFAFYILEHPEAFPDWKQDVRNILDWVYRELGDESWRAYGVKVVHEQTAYRVPGNSHTARQAAAELAYAAATGDTTWKRNALLQLTWATYMVGEDGRNCYPRDEVWLTDGYGDYLRHYLRAFAFAPELAPADQVHLLSSTDVLMLVEYAGQLNRFLVPEVPPEQVENTLVNYRASSPKGRETLRLPSVPSGLYLGKALVSAGQRVPEGTWQWQALPAGGGLLTIERNQVSRVRVLR